MTQPSRIPSLMLSVAALLFLPTGVVAQVYVTPTVKPTPPGQLIVVNNGPGDQIQPRLRRGTIA
jgi:hypothetical protein